jgi:hypothetical protein
MARSRHCDRKSRHNGADSFRSLEGALALFWKIADFSAMDNCRTRLLSYNLKCKIWIDIPEAARGA